MTINRISQLGLLISLPVVLLACLRYVFRSDFLENGWFTLLTLSVCLILYGFSIYGQKTIAKPLGSRFRVNFALFTVVLLVTLLFHTFIHDILDKDYRHYLVEKRMNLIEEKLREIEANQKVQFEYTSLDSEKQRLTEEYTMEGTLKNIPIQLVGIGMFSFFLALVVRRYE